MRTGTLPFHWIISTYSYGSVEWVNEQTWIPWPKHSPSCQPNIGALSYEAPSDSSEVWRKKGIHTRAAHTIYLASQSLSFFIWIMGRILLIYSENEMRKRMGKQSTNPKREFSESSFLFPLVTGHLQACSCPQQRNLTALRSVYLYTQ